MESLTVRSLNPLGDEYSRVTLTEWYPRVDQTPWESIVEGARLTTQTFHKATEMKDTELIRFMLRLNHGTPLRQCGMIFRVSAPRFIIRQLTRHQVGQDANGSDVQENWNGWGTGTDVADIASQFVEVSGRFTEFDPKFYYTRGLDPDMLDLEEQHFATAAHLYRRLRERKVIKGDARSVLPESVYGEFKVAYNLQAFLHLFWERRPKGGAQWEAVQVVCAMWNLAYSFGFQKILELWADEKGLPYFYPDVG